MNGANAFQVPYKEQIQLGGNNRALTPSNSEIICGQNVSTKVVCGIFLFFEKKAMLKI